MSKMDGSPAVVNMYHVDNRSMRRAFIIMSREPPSRTCRRPAKRRRRSDARAPRACGSMRMVLGLCLAARTAVAGDQAADGGEGAGGHGFEEEALERLLWDAAGGSRGPGRPPNAQARASVALARLWQDDAEALCHVASVLASIGHTRRAEAACRRALRVQPREACAIFCVLHFALWTCDFDSADALRPRAVAAVESAVAAGPDEQPAGLGHLEALLVLPERLFARHLLQQARFLGAASKGGTGVRTPGPDVLQLLGARRAGGGALAVALLTSTARQHAHGYALLAALRGLHALSFAAHGLRAGCCDCRAHIMVAFTSGRHPSLTSGEWVRYPPARRHRSHVLRHVSACSRR